MSLSILIPCYNCLCVGLVNVLAGQCRCIDNLEYEIIVVDDGSTDVDIINKNKEIENIDNVHYLLLEKSKNRSAMRNRLATFGKYEWQLQVNANVSVVRDSYIENFLNVGDKAQVICGNTTSVLDNSNLRSKYEYQFDKKKEFSQNNDSPYCYFRNTNCMYHRSVFEKVSYDESISGYGYEDSVFGYELKKAGISIFYVDNPVSYNSNTSNEVYLQYTEESINNLFALQDKLISTSPLLQTKRRLESLHLLWIVRLYHLLFRNLEKKSLCGNSPSLNIYALYKLGHLSSIKV